MDRLPIPYALPPPIYGSNDKPYCAGSILMYWIYENLKTIYWNFFLKLLHKLDTG